MASRIYKEANDKHTDRKSYMFLAKEYTGKKDLPSLLGVLERSKQNTKDTISYSGALALDNDIKHIKELIADPLKA